MWGKESTRMARMPRRGLEGLGGGKESTLKSMKTASRTRKAAGAREGRPRRLGNEPSVRYSASSTPMRKKCQPSASRSSTSVTSVQDSSDISFLPSTRYTRPSFSPSMG